MSTDQSTANVTRLTSADARPSNVEAAALFSFHVQIEAIALAIRESIHDTDRAAKAAVHAARLEEVAQELRNFSREAA